MVEPLLLSATCAGGAAAIASSVFSRTSSVFGPVLTRGPYSQSLYLTFDGAPNLWMTPPVLTILRHYRVPATFFLLGRHVDQFPNMAWTIADAGHAIGSQSYAHPAPLLAHRRRLTHDLVRAHRTIFEVTGVRPQFIRPPFGHHPPSIHAAALQLGCQLVTWQVDANDGEESLRTDIRDRVMAAIGPGAIVRFRNGDPHDPYCCHSESIEALPLIISAARTAGYTFSALR
jgi:peptidoglycan/xylan/chitin deacetylase (PgdA/CDA1 family)